MERERADNAGGRFDPASVAILKELERLEGLIQDQQAQIKQCCCHQPAGHPARRAFDDDSSSRVSQQSHTAGLTPHYSPEKFPSPLESFATPRQCLDVDKCSSVQNVRPSHPGLEFDQYATRVQTTLAVPISSAVLNCATTEMGIEAMLRWPVFRQRLARLGIAADDPLAALLHQPPRRSEPVTAAQRPFGESQDPQYDVADAFKRENIQRLVDNFLVNNNPKNPVLDPASLRRDAEDFVGSPWQWDDKSCLMVSRVGINVCTASKEL